MRKRINKLGEIYQKLNAIEKLVMNGGMANLLTVKIASEKYGLDRNTPHSLSKEKVINKYNVGRRIYYSQREIDDAIYSGLVNNSE